MKTHLIAILNACGIYTPNNKFIFYSYFSHYMYIDTNSKILISCLMIAKECETLK